MANKVTMFLKDKLLLTWRGVVKENPTFVLVLGMCPTLGTTTSPSEEQLIFQEHCYFICHSYSFPLLGSKFP